MRVWYSGEHFYSGFKPDLSMYMSQHIGDIVNDNGERVGGLSMSGYKVLLRVDGKPQMSMDITDAVADVLGEMGLIDE